MTNHLDNITSILALGQQDKSDASNMMMAIGSVLVALFASLTICMLSAIVLFTGELFFFHS